MAPSPITSHYSIFYVNEITPKMYAVIIVASIINGPSEETFWRACMDDIGRNAGATERHRTIYGSVVFALWHTAFVIHLYPHDDMWWLNWGSIIAMTLFSGLVWMWILHKSGRVMPQAIYHSFANAINIFPMLMITVMGLRF